MKLPMMMTLLVLTCWAVLAEDRREFDEDALIEGWCRAHVEENTDYTGDFKENVISSCKEITKNVGQTTCADMLEENRTSYTETSPYYVALNLFYYEICPYNVAVQQPPLSPDCGLTRTRTLPKTIQRLQQRWRKGMGRITGGFRLIDCSKIPWQVRVLGPYYNCGGSIISDLHILTAAHCMRDVSYPSDVTIVLGEYDLNKEDYYEESVVARNVTIHPNWNRNTYVADIAVLTLQRPIEFDNPCVAMVCRNPNFHFDGLSCLLSGWGAAAANGPPASKLKMAMLKTHDGHNCHREFGTQDPDYVRDKDSMICAGHTQDGLGACEGDSGSPLVCLDTVINSYVQVGIVSKGPRPCGLSAEPTIFTNVAYFHDWIDKIMAENN